MQNRLRANPLKQRVLDGTVCFGTMIFELSSTGLPQILEAGGAEFVIYDLETAGLSLETVRNQIALTRGTSLVPFVRVPNLDARFVARIMDCGALGVMVPMVETGEQAAALVRATRFPPRGDRGTTSGLAHDDYQGGDAATKMAEEDGRVLTIAQIESMLGVENIDAIAATPDLDVLWLGHNDLAVSMGIAGKFEHPRFQEALDRIVAACRRHGKIAGAGARDAEAAAPFIARGFTAITIASDVQLIMSGLGREIGAARKALGTGAQA
jgi:2-keto-3-deoxy-L-rhamnonate aldolase RhmA